jgi:hypothetical protein
MHARFDCRAKDDCASTATETGHPTEGCFRYGNFHLASSQRFEQPERIAPTHEQTIEFR